MNLEISAEALSAVDRAIFITGSTRAGTTMMGQLIHSLASVEHINEPAPLFALLSLIDDIPEAAWRLLYASFLYEDHLLPALAGRRLNLNPHDDSSIFKVKGREAIEERHATSHRRRDLVPASRLARCSFKVPEMIPVASRLKARFPQTAVIAMVRHPRGVVASILEKRWYSGRPEDLLGADVFHRQQDGHVFPYWLPEDQFSPWLGMSELERACFSYAWQYEHLASVGDALVVDYDGFVADARRQFAALAARLGCNFGPRTQTLIEGVSEPMKERDMKFDNLPPAMRRRLDAAYEAARSRVTPL